MNTEEIKSGVDRVSVMKQLDHLTDEVNKFAVNLEKMNNELSPLLPLPNEEPSNDKDNTKVESRQPESAMMDIVTNLTSRIRMLNSEVCNVMENIQI